MGELTDPLDGLAPAALGAALSVLRLTDPHLVAARLGVEVAEARHQQRLEHHQISRQISAGTDWRRVAAQHVTHEDMTARRAQPGSLAQEAM